MNEPEVVLICKMGLFHSVGWGFMQVTHRKNLVSVWLLESPQRRWLLFFIFWEHNPSPGDAIVPVESV